MQLLCEDTQNAAFDGRSSPPMSNEIGQMHGVGVRRATIELPDRRRGRPVLRAVLVGMLREAEHT